MMRQDLADWLLLGWLATTIALIVLLWFGAA